MTHPNPTTHRRGPRATLVLGGTGKTGRRIVDRLQALDVPVRVGSRSAEPPFDWDDESTWAPALRRRRRGLHLLLPRPRRARRDRSDRARSPAAVAAGVEHLVLLSGRGEDEAQACERLIQDAGVDWTILRASWFSQNFSESYLLDAVMSGEVVVPAGDVPEPFVDADDIADVAVAALTEDGHAGQLYELTGPRMLTFAEATAEIAKAADRADRVRRPCRPTSTRPRSSAEGVPDDVIELVIYLFTTVLDGRNASLGDGVQRALGPRAPGLLRLRMGHRPARHLGSRVIAMRTIQARHPDRRHRLDRTCRRDSWRLRRCGDARAPRRRRPHVRRRHAARSTWRSSIPCS